MDFSGAEIPAGDTPEIDELHRGAISSVVGRLERMSPNHVALIDAILMHCRHLGEMGIGGTLASIVLLDTLNKIGFAAVQASNDGKSSRAIGMGLRNAADSLPSNIAQSEANLSSKK